MPKKRFSALICAVLLTSCFSHLLEGQITQPESFELKLRSRIEIESESGRFHAIEKSESWDPAKTAFIVCDMWDLHHCHNAVIRVGQMAPRMNQVLNHARQQGATIVHAPSSCMGFYKTHPARTRAIETPQAADLPEDIGSWCDKIPSEDAGKYPIDQADGGEDDDPEDHAKWAKKLESQGLNPRAPWTRQTDQLAIDETRDYISDSGPEIWSILESKKINNVVLLGVHTNMCVLGRPFGLRQMAKNGKHVVLMRDMTDTMYNPAAWPHVSHFSGTDLIVEHIEKFVCPTFTSDQLLGGEAFRFPDDLRPHIAIVMAEDEYKTDESLPAFAAKHLQKDFRVSLIFGSRKDRNEIPGLEAIKDADVLFLSIRRRTLRPEQLKLVRDFEASGKPMMGIRTASHAFCLRNKKPESGLAEWPELDAEVWGGSYSGHTKNGITYSLVAATGADGHPILKDVNLDGIEGHLSLYLTAPLSETTNGLLVGKTDQEESLPPVAWTNRRSNGGHSFYTSLGHVDDFAQEDFQQLLKNAISWLVENHVKR